MNEKNLFIHNTFKIRKNSEDLKVQILSQNNPIQIDIKTILNKTKNVLI